MRHIITFTTVFLWVVMISQPVLATDLTEPENVEIVDAWLTSDPQEGVRYHILRVCQDQEMPVDSVDCTQCIYKAKENGAMWIPANNRCLFRINDDDNYQLDNICQFRENHCLFYQIMSVGNDQKSNWSKTRPVMVLRRIINLNVGSEQVTRVRYYWDKAECDLP